MDDAVFNNKEMKKRIWLILLLLIVVGGAIAFYILSQPPKETLSKEFKEEAVTKLLGRKAQLDADNIPTGNTVYKGKYITFEYPAKALIYTFRDNSTSSQSANLEDLSFDIKEPKLVFNYKSQAKGPASSLGDIPAVKLRETRSEYKKGEIKIEEATGVSFFNPGANPEKSGFIMHEGNVFTFSVTGTNAEEVEKLFDAIVSSASFLPEAR